jgi:ATP adenylyltransferase
MKRMWSPWRSQYIAAFKSPPRRNKRMESLFTVARKAGEDDKHLIVWRGKTCFVIMNRYPYNSGHLMVVPNRQTRTLQDLSVEELTDIMRAVQRSIRALDAVMGPQGYNIGVNQGRVSGAGVANHVHFHIVPRWNGDTNFMPVLADTKVISEDMRQTLKKLRKFFLSDEV